MTQKNFIEAPNNSRHSMCTSAACTHVSMLLEGCAQVDSWHKYVPAVLDAGVGQ